MGDRDPQLRLDVVYSSRSKARSEAAVARLRARHFTVFTGLDEHRTGRGRRVRDHQVLVPSGQREAAVRVIERSPVEADGPEVPWTDRHGPRARMGDSAYEGLMTVLWLAGALAVLSFLLLRG